MPDLKITEMTEDTLPQSADLLATVEDPSGTPVTKKITLATLLSGWINDSNTWTYVSASTFTISGDQTTIITKGTKLKFTQTTVKYAVVVASSYSAPNTTVTIQVNTDYTIANAAITLPAYSYAVNPQGYPGWFNLAAPTWTLSTIDDGAGGQPTTAKFRISIEGNTVLARCEGTGTKVATNWYFTHNGGNLPAPANITASVKNAFGSCNAWWASNDFNGLSAFHSVDGWYEIFNSDVNITDNQAFNFSWEATYEF